MGEGFLEEVAWPSQLPFCTAGSDAAWAGPAISASLQEQGQQGEPVSSKGWAGCNQSLKNHCPSQCPRSDGGERAVLRALASICFLPTQAAH